MNVVHAPGNATTVLVVLLPLIAWRVYARFKRMVGRQRLTTYRIWIQLTLFPALVLLIGLASAAHPLSLVAFVASLAAGAALGRYGIRTTAFQPDPGGLFYTPNAHLGIALSVLFVLRLAYRLVEVYTGIPGGERGAADFARSPLTLTVFGLLAGYYVAYAVGLARWRSRVLEARRRRTEGERGEPS